MRRHAVGSAVAFLAACGSPTASGDAGGIRAVADRDSVRVTNATARPAFVFAVAASLTPSINWAACADAAVCPPIPPGGTRGYARSALGGPPAEREAAVYWWHAGPRVDGVVRPDSIRLFAVPLP